MSVKHIISLGAGVQSSTMALMAAKGELGPMPEAAIFADTGVEPLSVYAWLDWLEKELPFPVYRVSKGNLGETATSVRLSRNGNYYTKSAPPAFMEHKGKVGPIQRQCTSDFKIAVIEREIRRLRNKMPIIQWIGISTDEAHRMKPARLSYVENRWPLIEATFSRDDCLSWMRNNGYPEPPRSSCVFCPFHNNTEWQRLKTAEPAEFERAVQFEKDLQSAFSQTKLSGRPFLHRSCQPLDTVDFIIPAKESNQFGNECAGVCGV